MGAEDVNLDLQAWESISALTYRALSSQHASFPWRLSERHSMQVFSDHTHNLNLPSSPQAPLGISIHSSISLCSYPAYIHMTECINIMSRGLKGKRMYLSFRVWLNMVKLWLRLFSADDKNLLLELTLLAHIKNGVYWQSKLSSLAWAASTLHIELNLRPYTSGF